MLDISVLRAELLQKGIPEDAWQLCLFDEIDSTNAEAKRMAAEGIFRSALLVAETQLAGRGRMGRSFYSPPTSGLYFSLLYRVDGSMPQALSITSAAAVAVRRAIQALTDIDCGIKWVNDLYLNEKKVAGILAESMICGKDQHVVLGIGINLSTQSFPKELQTTAGCIDLEMSLQRERLLAEIIWQMTPFLSDPSNDSWLKDYRAASTVLGKPIRWLVGDKSYEGTAEEITSTGALLVRDAYGERCELSTGEITVRPR